MIDTESFNYAILEINPQHAAINSIVGSFGPTEGAPLVDDLLRAHDVDPEAFRALGSIHLAGLLNDGVDVETAKLQIDKMLLGVVIGIVAAKYEGVNFGDV